MKTVLALASMMVLGYAAPSLAGGGGANPEPTVKDLATCTATARQPSGSTITKASLYTVNEVKWGNVLPPNTAMKLDLNDGTEIYLPLVQGTEVDLAHLGHVYLDMDSAVLVPTKAGQLDVYTKAYLNISRDNAADANELTLNGSTSGGVFLAFSGTLKCKAL